jgi:hypothetical protein
VDHTPLEMGSPTKSLHGGPSVDFLPLIANTVETGVADSTGEVNVVYGPVVDQTTTSPVPPMLIKSYSVLVQRNGDVDSVDKTTVVGGSRLGYGNDTVNEDIPTCGLKYLCK